MKRRKLNFNTMTIQGDLIRSIHKRVREMRSPRSSHPQAQAALSSEHEADEWARYHYPASQARAYSWTRNLGLIASVDRVVIGERETRLYTLPDGKHQATAHHITMAVVRQAELRQERRQW